jgi:hypothetical protein
MPPKAPMILVGGGVRKNAAKIAGVNLRSSPQGDASLSAL